MTTNTLKLVLPDHLQEEMEFHEVLHCAGADGASVLIMIHDMSADDQGHAVRTYMLEQENDEFIVHFELEAFAFPSHESAVLFANRLPSLSALELLMIQNGYDFKLMEGNPFVLQ